MLYWLLKIALPFGIRTYFRRIYFSGLKKIPRGKPFILAPNHPNSFLDDLVVGTMQPRALFFLARSDLFKNPIARFFLNHLHTIPVYRRSEARDQMHKNEQTFRRCYELLNKGKVVLIHSEGLTIIEKNLRPLKKGTARMGLEALEAVKDHNVPIIPLSVNYTYSLRSRTEMMIHVCDPIYPEDYKELYEKNNSQAINVLTEKLEERLREYVVATTKETDHTIDIFLRMIRPQYYPSNFIWRVRNNKRLSAEKQASDAANKLYREEPEKYKSFEKLVFDYDARMKNYNLAEDGISSPRINLAALLLSIITMPLSALGFIVHYPFYMLASLIANRMVSSNVFYSSVKFGSFFVTQILLYLAIFIVGYQYFDAWGLLLAPLSFVSGYLFLFMRGIWIELFQKWRFRLFRRRNKAEWESMLSMRKEMKEMLGFNGKA